MSLAAYPKRFCPVCHQAVRQTFRSGPGGRPDARCPRCRGLERHRFFAVLGRMALHREEREHARSRVQWLLKRGPAEPRLSAPRVLGHRLLHR